MKPHRTDVLSLVFGVLFLFTAGWWFSGRRFPLAIPQLGWFAAGALIVFGAVGLFTAFRSDARRRDGNREGDPFDVT